MNKIVITFHRTYEIKVSDIKNSSEMTKEDIIETALKKTRDLFSEESTYFEENTSDFVSHTIEII